MSELRNAFLVAGAALGGGLVSVYFSPKPRTLLKYIASGTIACFIGYITAHASRLEPDHQLFLALVVGISANKILDHFLIKAWEPREIIVMQNTYNDRVDQSKTDVGGISGTGINNIGKNDIGGQK